MSERQDYLTFVNLTLKKDKEETHYLQESMYYIVLKILMLNAVNVHLFYLSSTSLCVIIKFNAGLFGLLT